MGMQIKPIAGKTFGAVVEDVDLRAIDTTDFAALKAAFLEHGFHLSLKHIPVPTRPRRKSYDVFRL